MAKRDSSTSTNPIAIFFLALPYGISIGFVSVTLPFLLVQHGFSVADAAAITALGISANLFRFLWAPLADLTLSLHKWYIIGVVFSAISLLCLCFPPLNINSKVILTVLVFISQLASTFVVSPVGGMMAKTVSDEKKGRAGGWYQAGNLGGMGAGGGAGIWFSDHFSYHISIIVLSIAMLACAAALHWVPKIKAEREIALKAKFKVMLIDVKDMFKSKVAIFTMLVILTPIGSGAASSIWSSAGADWHVSADRVAVVTGILSGVITTIGCVFGGWIADKLGNWWAYLGSGLFMGMVTIIMCVFAFTPFTFTTGVLLYSFMMGFANAAFSAVVLFAIGKGLASTKYALLSSLGNVGPVYMTYLDGWLHDKYHVKGMLFGEGALGIIFVVIVLGILLFTGLAKVKKLPDPADDAYMSV